MKCEKHIIPPEFQWLEYARNVINSPIGSIAQCEKCGKYLHVWYKYDEDDLLKGGDGRPIIIGRALRDDETAKVLMLDLRPPLILFPKM